MKLLLVNTKRFLPPDMRKWAQDAKSLEELRNTLLDNARLWFDSMQWKRRSRSSARANKGMGRKTRTATTRRRSQFALGFRRRGFADLDDDAGSTTSPTATMLPTVQLSRSLKIDKKFRLAENYN